MKMPTATYRLQFRSGFDFERAIPVARYLAELGISHLYASPIFQAQPGSTHGYDVTDHHHLDESLGGFDAFKLLSAELTRLGLGLILDIVPNHMAASVHNPWWRDVLKAGHGSRYAGYFDIDWSREKLLLPMLGRSFEAVLEAGELALGLDEDGLTLRYFDHALPLDPTSWGMALHGFREIDPAGFSAWHAERANREALADHLATLSRDKALIDRIHAAQPYRLSHWHAARDRLGYRRFFEISDLVGVPVEESHVFDDVHAFIFELVEAGHVDGLRIDHVDGLADPKGYLSDLRRKLPRAIPVWIEKILAVDETLPADWPTVGATGYEFSAAAGRLLTNGDGIAQLDCAYRGFSGVDEAYSDMVGNAKVEILTRNLAAELNALVGFAEAGLAAGGNRSWEKDQLQRGIIALMAALPVYRTYFTSTDAPDTDLRIIEAAAAGAKANTTLDEAIVDLLVGLLKPGSGEAARAFRTRFQQTSAALEAKAAEDTVFYRFNRLLSANEVGADPALPSLALAEFHTEMAERASSQAFALNATATHDTKRGEDARMRIAAISEAPAEWAACVARFEAALGEHGILDSCEPNMRWLFYQSLLGTWEGPEDQTLRERMGAFLLKAARENKQRTSWVDPDEAYEEELAAFVDKVLSREEFLLAFDAAAQPFIEIGERKSLVQLGLKLFSPGLPDIYQGTEFADLSLVDPDNRRPVDFARRSKLLEGGETDVSAFDRRKISLLRFGLRIRRQWPELFGANYRCATDGEQPRSILFARDDASRQLLFSADLSGRAQAPSWKSASDEGRIIEAFPSPAMDQDFGLAIAIVDRVFHRRGN